MSPIERLKACFPWPGYHWVRLEDEVHGWFKDENHKVLLEHFKREPKTIVEVGSWMGLSAKWIVEQNPNATLICIDTWLGSRDHHHPDSEYRKHLPKLYESFLQNLSPYRERVIPARLDSVSGLRLLRDLGIEPDLVYIDGGHDAWQVFADAKTTLDAWPNVALVGDDWLHPEVQIGVRESVKDTSRNIKAIGNCWWLES